MIPTVGVLGPARTMRPEPSQPSGRSRSLTLRTPGGMMGTAAIMLDRSQLLTTPDAKLRPLLRELVGDRGSHRALLTDPTDRLSGGSPTREMQAST
jgi:hypothetical protein